jgi:S-(hydroxymethyl)glutathione dehydrogenase/alcohol dehydrogenase
MVRRYASVGSFAERITVSTKQLVYVTGLPAPEACLIGCAISTGFGVVHNVVRPTSGDRIAVVGVGGIGLMAIQAARLLGAHVTAIDVNPGRERDALVAGADAFASAHEEVGVFDATIECSGSPAATEDAISMTAVGGTTALVGLPGRGHRASFDVGDIMRGKRIVGSLNGDILPIRDIPIIVDHLVSGRLSAKALARDMFPMENARAAITAVQRGSVLRPILIF